MTYSEIGTCPYCNSSWNRGDILHVLREHNKSNPYTEEELLKMAKSYGYTIEQPRYFSHLVGIEDLLRDRIGYYECPFCKCRFERSEIMEQ